MDCACGQRGQRSLASRARKWTEQLGTVEDDTFHYHLSPQSAHAVEAASVSPTSLQVASGEPEPLSHSLAWIRPHLLGPRCTHNGPHVDLESSEGMKLQCNPNSGVHSWHERPGGRAAQLLSWLRAFGASLDCHLESGCRRGLSLDAWQAQGCTMMTGVCRKRRRAGVLSHRRSSGGLDAARQRSWERAS